MDEFKPSPHSIEVIQVLEAVTLTEFSVPLELAENPGASLFETVAEYVRGIGTEVPIVSFTCHYRDTPFPLVMGILCTGNPVGDGGPLDAMDQSNR